MEALPVNRTEVKALLTFAALYDRRPVGDADVVAWLPLMMDISFEDGQTAIMQHHQETRDWLTPHDVIRRVQAHRNRRIADSDFAYVPSDPDEPPEAYLPRLRAQLAAVADGQPLPIQAQALKARPMKELISGMSRTATLPKEIKEKLAPRRHPALAVTCPGCRTRAGDVCRSGVSGNPLGQRVHPSRIDAWAVVAVPCPECRVRAGEGCRELGEPYKHGAHRGRVEAAQEAVQ